MSRREDSPDWDSVGRTAPFLAYGGVLGLFLGLVVVGGGAVVAAGAGADSLAGTLWDVLLLFVVPVVGVLLLSASALHSVGVYERVRAVVVAAYRGDSAGRRSLPLALEVVGVVLTVTGFVTGSVAYAVLSPRYCAWSVDCREVPFERRVEAMPLIPGDLAFVAAVVTLVAGGVLFVAATVSRDADAESPRAS